MSRISFDSTTPFKGRHFNSSIIILYVRWYITHKLSYREQHYVPEFNKKWNRLSRPVGNSRRGDETYIRVRGEKLAATHIAVRELKEATNLPVEAQIFFSIDS
jgi:transposase-like protein